MSHDEFWNATPAEIERVMWAYRRRQREQVQYEELKEKRLAYLIDSLRRRKRLPSPQTWLAPPVVITPEEQRRLQAEHERMLREMS
jgi:hypothetical protein